MRKDAIKVKRNRSKTKEEPVTKTQKRKPDNISCEGARPQAVRLYATRPRLQAAWMEQLRMRHQLCSTLPQGDISALSSTHIIEVVRDGLFVPTKALKPSNEGTNRSEIFEKDTVYVIGEIEISIVNYIRN